MKNGDKIDITGDSNRSSGSDVPRRLTDMLASRRETLFRPLTEKPYPKEGSNEPSTDRQGEDRTEKPYPKEYECTLQLMDGTKVSLGSALPSDEQLMADFYKTLSENSAYLRWGTNRSALIMEYLKQACSINYNQDMTLVAQTKQGSIVGVGQLIKDGDGKNEAELALIISDQFHRKKLGSNLLDQLIQLGRNKGLQRITSSIYSENDVMKEMCCKQGTIISQDDFEVRTVFYLRSRSLL